MANDTDRMFTEFYGFMVWISFVAISIANLLVYCLSPLREYMVEQVWQSFTQGFHPGVFHQFEILVPPYNAGDLNMFMNYQHFCTGFWEQFEQDRRTLQMSLRLKIIFSIETAAFLISYNFLLIFFTILLCFSNLFVYGAEEHDVIFMFLMSTTLFLLFSPVRRLF